MMEATINNKNNNRNGILTHGYTPYRRRNCNNKDIGGSNIVLQHCRSSIDKTRTGLERDGESNNQQQQQQQQHLRNSRHAEGSKSATTRTATAG
jgi:hypothetical protein